MTAPDSRPLLAGHAPSGTLAWRRGVPITVGRFLADVARTAGTLPAGQHVLNLCADRYAFAVGLAATAVAGKTSLLPSTLTQEVAVHLREFAPDTVCLAEPGLPEPAGHGFPRVEWAEGAPDDALAAIPEIPSGHVLAWVFTSGSTGLPVPHRKTWGAMVRNVRAAAAMHGFERTPPPAIVATVPPQHMYGLESTVLLALLGGAALVAERPLYPADICAALEAVPRPRLLVTTPFHLRALLDAGVTIPPLDGLLSATAPLSPALAQEAEARCGAPLHEIYGSTETGQIARRRTTEGPAWTLFPGVKLAFDGEHASASGGHVEGTVALGDMLEDAGPGRFLLHGRSADMVNIAGKRSSLAYLDHQLRAIPGVADGAFWLPEETPDGITRLAAAVVAPGLDAAAITRALRERVESAFLPRRIVFVDALPRNATGKLPEAALRALFATGGSMAPGVARAVGASAAADGPELASGSGRQ